MTSRYWLLICLSAWGVVLWMRRPRPKGTLKYLGYSNAFRTSDDDSVSK
jgi:hypothetical protein